MLVFLPSSVSSTNNQISIGQTSSPSPPPLSLHCRSKLSDLQLSPSAMAAVLESLTVPRSSVIPSSVVLPAAATSLSSVPGCRASNRLPRVRGLKIQIGSGVRCLTLGGSKSRIARRAARIVCETQDTAVEVSAVTESTWQSLVLDSELPVLVEFWAPWCGPCRMIHPVIDELSKQYGGKLKCYKVNTDESPSIATQYGIRSIPTVMIFKGGEKKDAVIGAVPKSTLCTSIEKFL